MIKRNPFWKQKAWANLKPFTSHAAVILKAADRTQSISGGQSFGNVDEKM